jgi:phage I-like protein
VSRYGYWVDMNSAQLGEASWIQALPVGKFEHPVYGQMDFTPDRIKKFAASVKSKVRGIELDIDYDHKAQDGKAAGWVKDADVRPDGLYLQVDWTSRAAEAIRAGEYRYFSPEFDDEWTDASGGKHTEPPSRQPVGDHKHQQ